MKPIFDHTHKDFVTACGISDERRKLLEEAVIRAVTEDDGEAVSGVFELVLKYAPPDATPIEMLVFGFKMGVSIKHRPSGKRESYEIDGDSMPDELKQLLLGMVKSMADKIGDDEDD